MWDIFFIFLVLVSALLSSVHATLMKTSKNRGVTIITTSILYIMLGIFLAFIFPLPSLKALYYIIVASIFTTIQVLASHFALNKWDLTLVWPFQAWIKFLTTVIVSMFIFNEAIKINIIISIVLIIISIFCIKPLKTTNIDIKAILWSILFWVSLSIQLLLTAKGIQYVSHPWSYIAWDFIISLPIIISAYFIYKKEINIKNIKKNFKHNFSIMFTDMLSYSIILYLFYMVNVTEVFIWRQASLLFTLIIGYFFLKEKTNFMRVLGFLILVFGLVISKI